MVHLDSFHLQDFAKNNFMMKKCNMCVDSPVFAGRTRFRKASVNKPSSVSGIHEKNL